MPVAHPPVPEIYLPGPAAPVSVFADLQEGWADLLNRYTEAGVEERVEVVKELQAHEIEACEDIPLWNLKTYVVVNSSRLDLPTQFQYGIFNYERHLEQWHLK